MHIDEISVELKHITCWHQYGYLTFNRINMNIKKGTNVLIYGRRNSQLSDLYQIISGGVIPDEGKMYIRGKMCCIPEHFPILKDMNVKEYLILALLMDGFSRKYASNEAEKLLGEFSWENKGSMKVEFLRPLDRCLLLLLMAEIRQPDIFLVGNCTSDLEKTDEDAFWMSFQHLIKLRPITLIVLSNHKDIAWNFHQVYEIDNSTLIGEHR